VIPTLNSEATLGKCLRSLASQTLAAREVLIVDGGSTDQTVEIARSFPGSARVIEAGGGRSSSRRTGAGIATGKYLLFVDSDQVADRDLIAACTRTALELRVDCLKVPERVEGEGVWARCLRMDMRLVQSEELTYPRFFSKAVYERLGGHAAGLEDFMEDRHLFLRAQCIGATWGWAPSGLANPVGHLDLFQMARRRAHAARDSGAYYRSVRPTGDTVGRVVSERLTAFLRNARELSADPLLTTVLPVYYVITYVPRLARVGAANLRRGTSPS
jgi:glycosyltransferase involved in cell wall biosynthesis